MKSLAIRKQELFELECDDSNWDYKTALKNAIQERDALLNKHPELQELQDEVDRRLASASCFEERMKILGKLIGDRLNRLYDECVKLENLCTQVGIKVDIPITHFKRSQLTRNVMLIENKEK